MLKPLPSASLTICLALSSSLLNRTLRRGRSQGGEVGVREHACGSTPGIAAYPRHRGIPQVSQRQVGLAEGLHESSCSFWTDVVAPQTASTGVEAGVKKCSTGVDMKANTHSGGAKRT